MRPRDRVRSSDAGRLRADALVRLTWKQSQDDKVLGAIAKSWRRQRPTQNMGHDRHEQSARQTSPLVKIPEAAPLPSIGRSTVYGLIADGHLDTVHFGRAVRITTASTEAFVDRRQSEHPQTTSESTRRR